MLSVTTLSEENSIKTYCGFVVIVSRFALESVYELNGLYAEGIAIVRFFWDGEKVETIYNYMKDLYVNNYYYGWSFSAALLSLLVNIRM